MEILREYGVATHIYVPVIKRAVVDFAVGADWTPAAGDVKISKDGGAAASVTNLPTAIAMGNGAVWDFSLTATEMQAAQIVVTVIDAATKAVEDQSFLIATYGNASARHKVNLNDSVRAGLTALPNAAAEAAGGLYTRGAGAGQINQPANGVVDANAVSLGTQAKADVNAEVDGALDTAIPGVPTANSINERIKTMDDADLPGRLPAALVGGRMSSQVGAMAVDVIDAGALAASANAEIADAQFDQANGVESSLTMRQFFRLAAAVLFGKAAGLDSASGTATFRDMADLKNRVTATKSSSARTAVTLDPT